jgi:hypothetical protein
MPRHYPRFQPVCRRYRLRLLLSESRNRAREWPRQSSPLEEWWPQIDRHPRLPNRCLQNRPHPDRSYCRLTRHPDWRQSLDRSRWSVILLHRCRWNKSLHRNKFHRIDHRLDPVRIRDRCSQAYNQRRHRFGKSLHRYKYHRIDHRRDRVRIRDRCSLEYSLPGR